MKTYYPIPSEVESVLVTPNSRAAEHEIKCVSFQRVSVFRFFFLVLLSLVTFGIFLLVCCWYPRLWYRILYKEADKPHQASRARVVARNGKSHYVPCNSVKASAAVFQQAVPFFRPPPTAAPHENRSVAIFLYRCKRYHHNPWTDEVSRLFFETQVTPSSTESLRDLSIGDQDLIEKRRELFGSCCIDIPIQPFHRLIAEEVLHPFYVFQIAAIALWLWDEYYQYAAAIIIITVLSTIVSVFEARWSQVKLRRMARFTCDVEVVRPSASIQNAVKYEQFSLSLVPGDVIEIKKGSTLPCDVLLLKGGVVVNESMLTGESCPICKEAPRLTEPLLVRPQVALHGRELSRHTLFGGTEVIGVRQDRTKPADGLTGAYGMVLSTGFDTAQGAMVRSILYPESRESLDFTKETYVYLGILIGAAFLMATWALAVTLKMHLGRDVVIIRTLDTFTNAIPPALPATVTAGVSVAIVRLRRQWKVMCIAPTCVNRAGQVQIFVFDKTGTLTEEGLTLEGVVTSTRSKLTELQLGSLTANVDEMPLAVQRVLACCHSITLLDGEAVGEELELQMLQLTGASLLDLDVEGSSDEPDSSNILSLIRMAGKPNGRGNTTYAVVVRHDFDPTLQRSSVVVRKTGPVLESAWVLCKGSPERLEGLCRATSIPTRFKAELQRYTEQGMRVLALAHKEINISEGGGDWLASLQHQDRESLEKDLTFLGFAVYSNRLKSTTTTAIDRLRNARCTCIMATGDNPLTAAAVAREAHVIKSQGGILVGELNEAESRVDWTHIPHTRSIFNATAARYTQEDDLLSDEACGPCDQYCDPILTVEKLWKKMRGTGRNPGGRSQSPRFWQRDGPSRSSSGEIPSEEVAVKEKETMTTSTADTSDSQSNFAGQSSVETMSGMSSDPESVDMVVQVNSAKENGSMEVEQMTAKPFDLERACRAGDALDDVTLVLTGSAFRFLLHQEKTVGERVKASESADDLEAGRGSVTSAIPSAKVEPSGNHSHQKTLTPFAYCLQHCVVFARMSPDDKASLVCCLQSLRGHPLVGMCGDGANDCAALRAADVALSLSSKEASIAASFTSTTKSVRSAVDLLREGRAALINSFQCFKFITLYALLQASSTTILYTFGGNLTDEQFFWIDLILVLPLSITMAWTNASDGLSEKLPVRRLISWPVGASIAGHFVISMSFLAFSILALVKSPFYTPFKPDQDTERFDSDELASFENTTIFIITGWQYLILNLVLSNGRPWRKSILTNWMQMTAATVLIILSALFTFNAAPALTDWLSLVDLPSRFRWTLIWLVLANIAVSGLYEHFVVKWVAKVDEKSRSKAG